MSGSEDASYWRETNDERNILAQRDDDIDAQVLELRRDRENATNNYEVLLTELRQETERIENARDAMILRYDTRIGDLITAAEKAGLA